MESLIRTSQLTRIFGHITAANEVNLEIRRGEIYGFLGLNGAGKTTVIRMLLGMIKPTSGNIYLFGKQIKYGAAGPWSRVGQMVEVPYAYPELTVRENLEVFRRLRLLESKKVIEEIAEQLLLTRYLDMKARNLSLGNAQRLGLARALIHKPELLVLDEPANGLDPAGIVHVRDMLTNLAQNHQVTIFLSSHILGEISRFATRIGIIHEGRLIREEETSQLHSSRERRLVIRTRDNIAAGKILSENGYALQTHTAAIEPGSDPPVILSGEQEPQHVEKITELLVQHKLPPSHISREEEDLEQFFFRIIQQNNRHS